MASLAGKGRKKSHRVGGLDGHYRPGISRNEYFILPLPTCVQRKLTFASCPKWLLKKFLMLSFYSSSVIVPLVIDCNTVFFLQEFLKVRQLRYRGVHQTVREEFFVSLIILYISH